jgi:hypothetical protein
VQVPFGRVADLTILDAEHGSALALWRRAGEPAFPTREQQEALRTAGGLPATQSLPLVGGMIRFSLAAHALALVEVAP